MQDDRDAVQGGCHAIARHHVAPEMPHAGGVAAAAAPAEDAQVAAVPGEKGDDMAADVSGATGHENGCGHLLLLDVTCARVAASR